ncbi:hypothetical protein Rsub_11816 [Raphidocelis subcapitata]|uniref:Uncharacterized protein n=1 Tax=Raphidocelis subcapitata TaxID=307507 RepID=A0A2V0PJ15_9CHLO|nr:hypothetical protein Rsub_11816 [Raphidocelis subcapitata]|eukprot:GBF99012.1 hypothetical protein Rsub_11816 [Raphidocelis subcapitata]
MVEALASALAAASGTAQCCAVASSTALHCAAALIAVARADPLRVAAASGAHDALAGALAGALADTGDLAVSIADALAAMTVAELAAMAAANPHRLLRAPGLLDLLVKVMAKPDTQVHRSARAAAPPGA